MLIRDLHDVMESNIPKRPYRKASLISAMEDRKINLHLKRIMHDIEHNKLKWDITKIEEKPVFKLSVKQAREPTIDKLEKRISAMLKNNTIDETELFNCIDIVWNDGYEKGLITGQKIKQL